MPFTDRIKCSRCGVTVVLCILYDPRFPNRCIDRECPLSAKRIDEAIPMRSSVDSDAVMG